MSEGKVFRISENILSDEGKDSGLPVVVTHRELPNIVSESSPRNNLPAIEMELVPALSSERPRAEKPKPTLPNRRNKPSCFSECWRVLVSVALFFFNILLWPTRISFIKLRNDTNVDVTCVVYPGRGLGNPLTLCTAESSIVDLDDYVLKPGEEQIFSIGKDKKDQHVFMLGCVILVLDRVRTFWPASVAITQPNDENLEFIASGIPIYVRGPEFKTEVDTVDQTLEWDPDAVYTSPLKTSHIYMPNRFFTGGNKVPDILDTQNFHTFPSYEFATVATWAFLFHRSIQHFFRCDPHLKFHTDPINAPKQEPAVEFRTGSSTVKCSQYMMHLFARGLVRARIEIDMEVKFADLKIDASDDIRKMMVAFAWQSKFDYMKYLARFIVNFYNEFVLLILESLDDGHNVYKIVTLVLGVIAVVPCNADRNLPSVWPGSKWKSDTRDYADTTLLYITPMAVGAVIQLLTLGNEIDGLAKQIVYITSVAYLFAISFAAICVFFHQNWPMPLKMFLSLLMVSLAPGICAAAIAGSVHDVFYIIGPSAAGILVAVIYGVRFGFEPTHLVYAISRCSVAAILRMVVYVLYTLFHFLYTSLTCQCDQHIFKKVKIFFTNYMNNVLHLLIFGAAVGTGYWALFMTDFYVTVEAE